MPNQPNLSLTTSPGNRSVNQLKMDKQKLFQKRVFQFEPNQYPLRR